MTRKTRKVVYNVMLEFVLSVVLCCTVVPVLAAFAAMEDACFVAERRVFGGGEW